MTIFAPITAIANSSVAILRISGVKALFCLEYLGVKKTLQPRYSALCKIFDPNSRDEIDEVLVTYFKAPHSFTGEDVVEINLHGSPYIIEKLIDILSEIDGVRLAEPGEFSKRAFFNNKMDLVQAEAIVDLINSETKEQHRQAKRQMNGDLSRIYEKWRFDLMNIMANLEAFIDFPEDDLPQDIVDDLENKVALLRAEIQQHLDDNKAGMRIISGLSLAIIGQVNVGKSSLINYLSKSDVAIVTEIAGTTRDVIEVHLEIAGLKVVISDTAGIRETQDIVEKEGIKRSIRKANEADLKILVVDGSNLDHFEAKNLELLDDDALILINKIDLKNVSVPLELKKFNPIAISIKEKINLDILIRELENKVKKMALPSSNPLITRARYRESLISALENLSQFSLKNDIELASEDIRMAIREVGKITGRVDVEEILDLVFSGFCIGK